MMNNNYNLISYEKIPSTQRAAAEIIGAGRADDRIVIVAAAQTAGRGRGTRKWVSNPGNLYASFIYKAKERRPTLSYAFAVGAAEALRELGVEAEIKWPNDILVGGRKLAGILLEYCRDFLIVGIGVNIKSNPPAEVCKTTKTDAFVKGLAPNKIVAELIRSFEKWRMEDFSVVRKKWLELSIDLNSEINYRNKAAAYCGLTEEGAMVMRIGDRYELIYGDEIFT